MVYSRGPSTEQCGRPYICSGYPPRPRRAMDHTKSTFVEERAYPPQKATRQPNSTALEGYYGLQCQKRRLRRIKLTMSAQLCQWPHRCQIVVGAAEFQLSGTS